MHGDEGRGYNKIYRTSLKRSRMSKEDLLMSRTLELDGNLRQYSGGE